MQKVYLASRYSSHPEMRVVRTYLERFGITVTSRWIDCHPEAPGQALGPHEDSCTVERLNAAPETCEVFARHDAEDIAVADTVISFTEGGGGKGGRHVEFGMAWALGKRLIIVGPRENVFHTFPEIMVFPDTQAMLLAIADASADGILL